MQKPKEEVKKHRGKRMREQTNHHHNPMQWHDDDNHYSFADFHPQNTAKGHFHPCIAAQCVHDHEDPMTILLGWLKGAYRRRRPVYKEEHRTSTLTRTFHTSP